LQLLQLDRETNGFLFYYSPSHRAHFDFVVDLLHELKNLRHKPVTWRKDHYIVESYGRYKLDQKYNKSTTETTPNFAHTTVFVVEFISHGECGNRVVSVEEGADLAKKFDVQFIQANFENQQSIDAVLSRFAVDFARKSSQEQKQKSAGCGIQ